jgi:Flp pilus assembly protein TadG
MREPRRGSDQEGQALVEFAVLSTPLFLILLGAIQFGFIYATQITVVNMARDGARTAAYYGTTEPSSDTDVLAAIKGDAGALSTATPAPLSITVSPATQASRTAGSAIKVTVTYSQTIIFPWVMPGNVNTITVTQSAIYHSQR